MIDQERLAELEDDFGAEDLHEIIDAFLTEAEETLEALVGTISDGASAERDGHLHFLKGCARNVGARELGDLCEQFEVAKAGYSSGDQLKLANAFQAVCAFFAGEAQKRTA